MPAGQQGGFNSSASANYYQVANTIATLSNFVCASFTNVGAANATLTYGNGTVRTLKPGKTVNLKTRNDGKGYDSVIVTASTTTVDIDYDQAEGGAINGVINDAGEIKVALSSDIQIGAVELKNATDDTRAKVGVGSSMAVGDNAVAVADPNVLSKLDIALSALRDYLGGASPNNSTLYALQQLLKSEPVLMLANFSSPEDGAAAFTSSATLTCSNFPFTVDSTVCNVLGILVTDVNNLVTKYINGHNGISLAATSNVITITGATPFLVTDLKYRIMIHYVEKAYDQASDTQKTSVQAWSPPQTTEPLPLISAAQTLTTSFADVGFEIPCSGCKWLGLYIDLDVNQGTGNQIIALVKHTSAGADEYQLPISTVSSTLIQVNPEIVQFPDADGKYLVKVQLDNVFQYVQIQAKESVDGGTDAILTSVNYTLGY